MQFIHFVHLLALAGVSLARPTNIDEKLIERAVSDSDSTQISTDKLVELISINDLVAGAQQLQDFAYAYSARNRVFGGQAHNDTINWIYDELAATGFYDVYLQEQQQEYSEESSSLTVSGTSIDSDAMTYSPSGNVTGQLVLVSNLGCNQSDFPSGVEGNIALIQRGTCTFSNKVALAGAAGALGAVVYNNVEGSLSGTLGSTSNELGPLVPVVGISQTDGTSLVAGLPSNATLYVSSILENRTTYNVIAETKSGSHDSVVMSGGHTDSVAAGPGINDDGSGIIANLVVAKALVNFTLNNAVRFGFWTAEEFGLLGSAYYVEHLNSSELAKIKAYLNFDMIASPNYIYGIYDGDGSTFNVSGPAGSGAIEQLFETFFNASGTPYTASDFDGRSDYQAFIDNGIPSGGLFTGAEEIKTETEAARFGGSAGVAYDINYHGAGDNVSNLALDAFEINSKAVAYTIATYASSFEQLNTTTVTRRATRPGSLTRARLGKRVNGRIVEGW